MLVRHPTAVDATVTVACMVLTVVPSVLMFPFVFGDAVAVAGLALSAGAPLFFRRAHPVMVLVVAAVLTVAGFAAHGLFLLLPLACALYAVTVYRSVWAGWIGFLGLLPLMVVAAVTEDPSPVPRPVEVTVATQSEATVPAGIALLIAVLIGTSVAVQRRHIAALAERGRQLEIEQEQRAELAAALERTRIAREMHDIIAHSLSVMVALADGSQAVLRTSPERAETAIREVATTGRKALSEMQGVLGALKEPGPPVPVLADGVQPPSGRESLRELVETFRVAGLPLAFTTTGPPMEDLVLHRVVYRILQEALTNTLRYAADATRVSATVDHRPDTIVVTVQDNGRHGGGQPSQGSRLGLLGLRERTALHGGTLQAGPHPDGGWQVTATIPTNKEARP
jgi:signal transduction histidine kinase